MAPVRRKRIVEPLPGGAIMDKNLDLIQSIVTTSTDAKAIKESLRRIKEHTIELELKLESHLSELELLIVELQKKLPKRSKLE